VSDTNTSVTEWTGGYDKDGNRVGYGIPTHDDEGLVRAAVLHWHKARVAFDRILIRLHAVEATPPEGFGRCPACGEEMEWQTTAEATDALARENALMRPVVEADARLCDALLTWLDDPVPEKMGVLTMTIMASAQARIQFYAYRDGMKEGTK
jgi:hypothetical protein